MSNRHNDWTEQMRQRLDGARVDVPDDLWAAIEGKLDEQGIGSDAPAEKPRRRVVPMWRWAAAASVVVAVGMGLWWQTRDGGAGSDGMGGMGIVASGGNPSAASGSVSSMASGGNPSAASAASSAVSAAAADMARQTDGGAAMLAARQSANVGQGARRAAATDGTAQEAVAATCAAGGDGLAVAATETAAHSSVAPAAGNAAQSGAEREEAPRRKGAKVTPRATAMLRSERQSATERPSHGGSRWQVGMATAGSMGRYNAAGGVVAAQPVAGYLSASAANNVLFAAEPMLNDLKETTHHDMPVAVGLTAAYRLTDRLALTSGLVYTLATSTFEHGTSGSTSKDEQSLHYIGIPLSASYEVWGNSRVQTYVTAGGQADFNVSARVTTDGHSADTDRDRAQFSVGGGLGVQLNVVKQLGVYVEPGVKYYFDNGSRVQNVFKAHPCNFSLQVGVRYNIAR